MVQSCGMYLWSIRSITPKIFFVQVQIIGPSPHPVILYCRESLSPHDEQAAVAFWLMEASRSLVGMRPCIAVYHVDFIASGAAQVLRFNHTRFQLVSRNFRRIRNSLGGLPFMASLRRTLYSRPFELFTCFVGCTGGPHKPYRSHIVESKRT